MKSWGSIICVSRRTLLFALLVAARPSLGDIQPILVAPLATGLPEVEINQFSLPRVGSNGVVGFSAFLSGADVNSGNNSSMWTSQNGQLSLIAREGDPIPGGVGTFASDFSGGPFLSFQSRRRNSSPIEANRFAFHAGMHDGSEFVDGAWLYEEGNLSPLVVPGTQAPGLPTGYIVDEVVDLWGSPTGEYFLRGWVRGDGIGPSNNDVLWKVDEGGIQAIYSEGLSLVPGSPGATFTSRTLYPGHNGNHFGGYEVTFADATTQIGVGMTLDGVWQPLVWNGESVNGLPSDVFFSGIPGGSISFSGIGPGMNLHNRVAFAAWVQGGNVNTENRSTVFVGGLGDLQAVARQGDAVPGYPNLEYDGMSHPVINDNSLYGYSAGIKSAGDSIGIFVGSDETAPQLVAKTGDQAPGFADGITFRWIREYLLTENDELLFFARLQGAGVDASNERGIWMYKDGWLTNIANRSDVVAFADGTSGTLSSFSTGALGGFNTGHMFWPDGNGNVVFDARVGGDHGIFSVPIPAGRGDFDRDGDFDCADIDALVVELASSGDSIEFDLTGDGQVTREDVSAWLAEAGAENLASGDAYLVGDADLNGVVDVSDFNRWNANKFTTSSRWCTGDFNADGFVDVSDFNLWNLNKFRNANVSLVPEPDSMRFLAWFGTFLLARQRRRISDAGRGRSLSRLPRTARRANVSCDER